MTEEPVIAEELYIDWDDEEDDPVIEILTNKDVPDELCKILGIAYEVMYVCGNCTYFGVLLTSKDKCPRCGIYIKHQGNGD